LDTVASSDGTLIAYERTGSGPPLVLVHGTTADHTRWAPLLPRLHQHFTVWAMDRRGRGGSGDSSEYSLASEFEDVAAVVRAAGPGTSLLGHSYGALCALEAALRTQNLRRLVLYEPAFAVDEEVYPAGAKTRLEALIAQGRREEALIAFYREVVQLSDAEIDLVRSDSSWPNRIEAVHTIPREFADADYLFSRERFASLSLPVALLMGETSPLFLKQATEVLAEALPNASIVPLPGQGHAAMTTAPDLFLQEVLAFLCPD